MSLTIDTSGCQEGPKPLDQVVPFLCALVGLPVWDARRMPEVIARIRILEGLEGPFTMNNGEPETLATADLLQYLGLRCNVTEVTRTRWVRTRVAYRMDEIVRSTMGLMKEGT